MCRVRRWLMAYDRRGACRRTADGCACSPTTWCCSATGPSTSGAAPDAGEEVTVTLSGATAARAGRCQRPLGADACPSCPPVVRTHSPRAPRIAPAERGRCAGGRCVAVFGAVEHGIFGARFAQLARGDCASANDAHPPGDDRARSAASRRATTFDKPLEWKRRRARNHRRFFGHLLLLRARTAEDRRRAASGSSSRPGVARKIEPG